MTHTWVWGINDQARCEATASRDSKNFFLIISVTTLWILLLVQWCKKYCVNFVYLILPVAGKTGVPPKFRKIKEGVGLFCIFRAPCEQLNTLLNMTDSSDSSYPQGPYNNLVILSIQYGLKYYLEQWTVPENKCCLTNFLLISENNEVQNAQLCKKKKNSLYFLFQ